MYVCIFVGLNHELWGLECDLEYFFLDKDAVESSVKNGHWFLVDILISFI